MKLNQKLVDLLKIAIVAAVYVALTVGLAPLSYGPIQFRISEVLVLLVFFNPKYAWSLILGCAISNCFNSPIDVVFGTLQTIVTVFLITKTKKLWLASLWPTITSFIIGAELCFIFHTYEFSIFLLYTVEVMLGEFVVVTCMGIPLFQYLTKNKEFMRIVDSKKELKTETKYKWEYLSFALGIVSLVFFFTLPMYQNASLFSYAKTSFIWFLLPIINIFSSGIIFILKKWSKIISVVCHALCIAALILFAGLICFNGYVILWIFILILMGITNIMKIIK